MFRIFIVFLLNYYLIFLPLRAEIFTIQNEVQSSQNQILEENLIQEINQIRKKHKLNQLKKNPQLMSIARGYSKLMLEENFFDHKSPQGLILTKRLKLSKINYSFAGENLFTCFNEENPSSTAIQAWLQSPPHKQNILNHLFNETGFGIWQNKNTYYFTQLFIKKK